jgi:hypothetical protein
VSWSGSCILQLRLLRSRKIDSPDSLRHRKQTCSGDDISSLRDDLLQHTVEVVDDSLGQGQEGSFEEFDSAQVAIDRRVEQRSERLFVERPAFHLVQRHQRGVSDSVISVPGLLLEQRLFSHHVSVHLGHCEPVLHYSER